MMNVINVIDLLSVWGGAVRKTPRPARLVTLSAVLTTALTMGLLAPAHAQSLLRDASVQIDRFVDAPLAGKLPAGTPVQVLKSEAGWSQIKAGDITGWVRASAINGEGAKTAATAQMQNGRLAGNNILSTSGIRGPEEAPASAATAASAAAAAKSDK